ncbi:MAG: rhodanese-like domain-containing protein [Thaumarchaeota archaeon]|nr:rhodanese-like domain-containing protein [Nitrososphaerota archaeon]
MAEIITAEQLSAQKDEFVIIDVRESDEIPGRQIAGSINIPLGLVIRNARQGKLDHLKNKKIVCHCSAGYRGNIAAEELYKCGFEASNLEGGFEAWSKITEK